MGKNTFTYTARSIKRPDKMATFTLHNGSVDVELGNRILEQVQTAFDTFNDNDEEADQKVAAWIKPAASGALQQLIEPIPLHDFDADIEDDRLHITTWIRAGGLRLVPLMLTWHHVDNAAGAAAFVDELKNRKDANHKAQSTPDPLDYWATWIVMGLFVLAMPVLFGRFWNERRTK